MSAKETKHKEDTTSSDNKGFAPMSELNKYVLHE